MIVTAHQPTYLPGVSVLAKVAAADVVIWLDDVRFTSPGWVNRNRLPDGTWLAVPVERAGPQSRIREVTIASDSWQCDHELALTSRYALEPHFDQALVDLLDSPAARHGEPLVELNLAVIGRLLRLAGIPTQQARQSALDLGGHSISERLARIVARHGGKTYLASPASSYLEPRVFERHGVELASFDFDGENPSSVDPLFRRGVLPTSGGQRARQEVRAA